MPYPARRFRAGPVWVASRSGRMKPGAATCDGQPPVPAPVQLLSSELPKSDRPGARRSARGMRRLNGSQGLKTPPLAATLASGLPGSFLGQFLLCRRLVARVDGAVFDPADKIGHDLRLELRPALRHAKVVARLANRLNQQAFACVACDNGRAAIATAYESGPMVEFQPTLGPATAVVALIARLDEHGPNSPLEEFNLFARRIRGQRSAEDQAQKPERADRCEMVKSVSSIEPLSRLLRPADDLLADPGKSASGMRLAGPAMVIAPTARP